MIFTPQDIIGHQLDVDIAHFTSSYSADLCMLFYITPSVWKQDLEVSVEEYKTALQSVCVGKSYTDFPQAFKRFIDRSFLTVDLDGKFANDFSCKFLPIATPHSQAALRSWNPLNQFSIIVQAPPTKKIMIKIIWRNNERIWKESLKNVCKYLFLKNEAFKIYLAPNNDAEW